MFVFGLILCLFLLRYWPFWVLCIGRRVILSLVLGVFLLLSCSFFTGERLILEVAVPKSRRVGRPISVSAVPFGPGIDIWRSCRFFGCHLSCITYAAWWPWWFLPGVIGANHCRLRHIGWDKCCHGLSSRPRETSSVRFLDELLVLFGYCAESGADLLAGVLPLRYSSRTFARKVPTWRLPVYGSVASFLASGELVRGGPSALSAALGGACVGLASGSGGGVRRVRLYRKTPAHLARQGSGVQFRSRVWKRLRDPLGSDPGLPGVKFLRVRQEDEGHVPGLAREGIG